MDIGEVPEVLMDTLISHSIIQNYISFFMVDVLNLENRFLKEI